MKRNDSDTELVKSIVLTCALHNLYESHGEDYQHEWDTPAVAEPVVVAVVQGTEEGRGCTCGSDELFEQLNLLVFAVVAKKSCVNARLCFVYLF